MRKLSGSEKQKSSLLSSLNVPEYSDLANPINDALLCPLQVYEPISDCSETVALKENPEFPVPKHPVVCCLFNNFTKLTCPTIIPTIAISG